MKKGSPKMQTNTSGADCAIAKKLTEFWLPHLIATEDLFAHPEYVDRPSKEIRAEALRLELLAYDDLLAKEVPEGWKFKEYRQRTIITLVGKITCLRRLYLEPSGICHACLDEILGIRTRMKLAPDAFLWIAKMASDVSCRKTARAFYERSGAKISHWLAMACVHVEGELILEEAHRRASTDKQEKTGVLPLSSEALFVEFDGIHIPLQKNTHESRKVRWLYEKDGKKHSLELKVGCLYAGKNGRRARLGCARAAFDAHSSLFWPLFNAHIAAVYDTEVISTVHSSADAAGWCKNNGLDVIATADEAVHHIDRFRLNREIRRAFGGKASKATRFIDLAYKKRTEEMMRDLQLVINHAKGKDKGLCLELQGCPRGNLGLIKQGGGPSMGTMEGTNAHVCGARMKVWGGAWSRKGAAAMAAIRARLASGEELVVPAPDNVLYDDYQIARLARYEEKQLIRNCTGEYFEGKGYEPPRGEMVLTAHMPPCLHGVLNYT